jgi:hypothetical protein
MGVMRPELVMKSIVPVREREGGRGGRAAVGFEHTEKNQPPSPSPTLPFQVVMAGVLGIYGLIIAVIISTGSEFSGGGCGFERRGGNNKNK